MRELELSELVARCRLGDDLAWEALVERLQGRVFAIAFHYLRDREEARDAAQEIFVRVFQKLHTVRDDVPFMAWFLRLARNCSIDRLRRLKVRTPPESVPVEGAQDLADPVTTPEEDCLRTARQRLLYRALGALTEVNREMILLKDIQELKLEEIASMLDLPLGTVKSRTSRARAELGRVLGRIEAASSAGGAS